MEEQIQMEEFKEFKSVLDAQGMTLEDAKELASSQSGIQRSA